MRSRSYLVLRIVMGLTCMLTTLACGSSEPARLDWAFELREPQAAARIVRMRARLLAGSCEGGALVYEASFRPGDTAPRPPEVSAGRYGVSGEAWDEDCLRVASGCTEVELPPSNAVRELVVLLAPDDEAPICAGRRCVDGQCDDGSGNDGGGNDRDAGRP